MKQRLLGNVNAQKYKTLTDVLRNTRTTESGCREWLGAVNKDGYAACNIGGIFRGRLLHREVLRLLTGERPPVVMHTCDNRKCINPEHLTAGTVQANVQDMDAKNRRVVRIRFTAEQVAAMIQRRNEGVSEKAVCAEFDISRGYLWKLMTGKHRSLHANH